VAGGFAWGSFVHFYPTFGFGAVFAIAIARLFGTNILAATIGWAVAMPLFPLFFYLNFKVGDLLSGVSTTNIGAAMQEIMHMKFGSLIYIGKAFLIGSVINGIVGVILIRWVSYLLLKRYRKKTLLFIYRNL
jgi:uncharacterized protein (DUF2062 family)